MCQTCSLDGYLQTVKGPFSRVTELGCSSTDSRVAAGTAINAGQVLRKLPDKKRLGGVGCGVNILASSKLSCIAPPVTGRPSPGKRPKCHRKEVKHVLIVTSGFTVLSICGSHHTFQLQRYGMFHDGQSVLHPC